MHYSFSSFILNTESKQLSYDGEVISITSQLYDLLYHFVSNPGRVFSKDELIDSVWKGRVVTENTIDQSISKLRKILNSSNKMVYIKTSYGKGFIFEPQVEVAEKAIVTKPASVLRPAILIISLFVVLITYFIYQNITFDSKSKQKPLLLIMSPANAAEESWLENSSVTYIDQILEYTDLANLKYYEDKPDNQDRQQYINNQWKISPNLQVVTTHVFQKDNIYTVELNLSNKKDLQSTQSFSNRNLAFAMKSASEWIAKKMDAQVDSDKIDELIPHDSNVVELYMRGLSSFQKGEIDKAGNFLQICIDESPDFYLARLEMAKVFAAQGNQEKSLAMLDTLSKLAIFPQLEIEIASTRGDIYDTQGQYEDAKELYLFILKKFEGQANSKLNDIRYNLSYTYSMLSEYENALSQLQSIVLETSPTQGQELLAHVYQKQASIYQKLGHMEEATDSANKSLNMFAKMDDVLGEAKVYVTLARISNHQYKYNESIQYLQSAIDMNRSVDYKLGVGATINELIYVLMVQGNFSKALKLNQEMQQIALEIGYNAMLQITKQYNVDINRQLQNWDKANMFLNDHLELAQASNNTSALLKNKLLSIDLFLDQKNIAPIKKLIDEVQQHINDSGEIRLQPRINKHLARYYFLTNNLDKAISVLLSSKDLANRTQDGETLIEINNLLAEYYLVKKDPKKAQEILEDSVEYEPLPYPYLLIKSKINLALGNTLKALDYANECKSLSNEWWTFEDNLYLISLEDELTLSQNQ